MSQNSYFIYYTADNCHGRISIDTKQPITSIADIERLEKTIGKENGKTGVMIISWQKFEEELQDGK